MKIEVVSATRKSSDEFWKSSALGISLNRIAFDHAFTPRIAYQNQKGLPSVYNDAIVTAQADSYIVFIHDDVWIDDYYLSQRVSEGLRQYDVIGVAGNRRRASRQPAWHLIGETLTSGLTWDDRANLSGAIGQGENPFGKITRFGEAPQKCELLDGLFLAAKTSALIEKNCHFDPQFDFHFYDMDFCRSARQRGLTLGTWPICLTHQSVGSIASEEWAKGCLKYRAKWAD